MIPLHIDPDLITNVEGDKRALRRTLAAARRAQVQAVYVGDNMQDWGFDPYAPAVPGRSWTGSTAATTTWNGPICHVCGAPYLGICLHDHPKRVGRHRA